MTPTRLPESKLAEIAKRLDVAVYCGPPRVRRDVLALLEHVRALEAELAEARHAIRLAIDVVGLLKGGKQPDYQMMRSYIDAARRALTYDGGSDGK